MNRQQLYTFGGALLASTALSSMANAATVGTSLTFFTGVTTTAQKIAFTAFSTTATTADAVTVGPGAPIFLFFTNRFSNTVKFSVELDISGAQFVTASVSANSTSIIITNATTPTTNYSTLSGATNCGSVTPLVSAIILDNCHSTTTTFTQIAAGIIYSGVTFNTANGLATSGGSISMSGRIYNFNNAQQTFENITSGSIVTSVAAISGSVTAAPSVVANPLSTPVAFTSLQSAQTTFGGTSLLSLALATVKLSGTGALSTDLSAPVTVFTGTSGINVTVTSSTLSSGAVASVSATAQNVVIGAVSATAANFSGGSQTFSVASANGTYSSFTIGLIFGGTNAIPVAAAGTVTVAFAGGGGAPAIQAAASITGTTAAVSRGGFNAEVNTFNSSAATAFQSFLRIHNNGGAAGAATVTVRNDASSSGAVLGTAFTTGTIQPGGTLQLAASDLEGTLGANIPAASRTGNYTVQVTGPIVGYVQHILYNPTTGQVSDVSAFRNNGGGGTLTNSP